MGRLIDALRFAQVQTAAATSIVKNMPADAPPADRQRALDAANALIASARSAVFNAAADVGLAVPAAVVDSFRDYGVTATNIATALAVEARNTVFGVAILMLAFLWLYSRGKEGQLVCNVQISGSAR